MNLTSLFNLKGLAIAFAIGLVAGGGSGYYVAVSQFERAAINAANTAAAAQHKQDVAQHGAAVVASNTGQTQANATQANTGAQVQVVHNAPTVFVKVPGQCPDDPVIAPDVLNAYNKAGH